MSERRFSFVRQRHRTSSVAEIFDVSFSIIHTIVVQALSALGKTDCR
jgi:hypothetical protein